MPRRIRTPALILLLPLLAGSLHGCRDGDNDPPASGMETSEMSNDASAAIAKLVAGRGRESEVVSAASGLQYLDLAAGEGEFPQPGQTCFTHATLWLLDGTRIWSSRDEEGGGAPFDFVLGGGSVIPGWDEGVASMRPGGSRRLAVPPELGYGAQGRPPVPPNATLIFEIELLEIR